MDGLPDTLNLDERLSVLVGLTKLTNAELMIETIDLICHKVKKTERRKEIILFVLQGLAKQMEGILAITEKRLAMEN